MSPPITARCAATWLWGSDPSRCNYRLVAPSEKDCSRRSSWNQLFYAMCSRWVRQQENPSQDGICTGKVFA